MQSFLRSFLVFSVFFCISVGRVSAVGNAKPMPLTDKQIAQMSVYTPNPDFPSAARYTGLSGRGIFRLHVRTSTGHVDSVQVVKSTGHKIFDDAALKALLQWQLRAHGAELLDIPVSFKDI